MWSENSETPKQWNTSPKTDYTGDGAHLHYYLQELNKTCSYPYWSVLYLDLPPKKNSSPIWAELSKRIALFGCSYLLLHEFRHLGVPNEVSEAPLRPWSAQGHPKYQLETPLTIALKPIVPLQSSPIKNFEVGGNQNNTQGVFLRLLYLSSGSAQEIHSCCNSLDMPGWLLLEFLAWNCELARLLYKILLTNVVNHPPGPANYSRWWWWWWWRWWWWWWWWMMMMIMMTMHDDEWWWMMMNDDEWWWWWWWWWWWSSSW